MNRIEFNIIVNKHLIHKIIKSTFVIFPFSILHTKYLYVAIHTYVHPYVRSFVNVITIIMIQYNSVTILIYYFRSIN